MTDPPTQPRTPASAGLPTGPRAHRSQDDPRDSRSSRDRVISGSNSVQVPEGGGRWANASSSTRTLADRLSAPTSNPSAGPSLGDDSHKPSSRSQRDAGPTARNGGSQRSKALGGDPRELPVENDSRAKHLNGGSSQEIPKKRPAPIPDGGQSKIFNVAHLAGQFIFMPSDASYT